MFPFATRLSVSVILFSDSVDPFCNTTVPSVTPVPPREIGKIPVVIAETSIPVNASASRTI